MTKNTFKRAGELTRAGMLAHETLADLIDAIGPEDSLALLLWLLVASEGKLARRCK